MVIIFSLRTVNISEGMDKNINQHLNLKPLSLPLSLKYD